MYLFIDTETTGLPKRWNAPASDFGNWPRMVQIAWILFDEKGNRVDDFDAIIKPDGFRIPPMVARIHGITQDIALRKGVELKPVMEKFLDTLAGAKLIIGHNIGFDEKILSAELLRLQLPNEVEHKKSICTMYRSAEFVGIRNQYGYKWPTLAELHYSVFNRGFERAHNAAVDIDITAKCFWELRKKGVL